MRKRHPLQRSAFLLLVTLLMAFASLGPAWALDLDDAKAQGLVGEQANGYLGAVKSGASGEVKALIEDINAKRRAKYIEIADRNRTSLEAVEALAGQTAIDKTPAGQYVRLPSGEWVKK